ncbi:MAG TPA: hypothetical protein VFA78_02460 [Chloroflexota bacterium]|nr:hypothetical protein [Chloroflexota bacterium]
MVSQRAKLEQLLTAIAAYHQRLVEMIDAGGPHARMVARITIGLPEWIQLRDTVARVAPRPKSDARRKRPA